MPRSRWPLIIAGSYAVLTFLGFAFIVGSGSGAGVKLALILGLPWSLFLADAIGSGTDLFLIFCAAMLNAGALFYLLRLVLRRSGWSQGQA